MVRDRLRDKFGATSKKETCQVSRWNEASVPEDPTVVPKPSQRLSAAIHHLQRKVPLRRRSKFQISERIRSQKLRIRMTMNCDSTKSTGLRA
ncbi:hypothetical protein PM082_021116 [Marasmius tenuissimus]|nr:hypothetical protein PM082_021116 [Marasmius tenuissimus]